MFLVVLEFGNYYLRNTELMVYVRRGRLFIPVTDYRNIQWKSSVLEVGLTTQLRDEIISSSFVFSVALGPSLISQ